MLPYVLNKFLSGHWIDLFLTTLEITVENYHKKSVAKKVWFDYNGVSFEAVRKFK